MRRGYLGQVQCRHGCMHGTYRQANVHAPTPGNSHGTPLALACPRADVDADVCGEAWPLRYVTLPDEATAAAIMQRSVLIKVRGGGGPRTQQRRRVLAFRQWRQLLCACTAAAAVS